MSDFVFQRLGKVVPGKQNAGKNSEDRIDGKPIVLWHGSTLAAALYTRLSSHAVGLTGEQRIERFDEQAGEGWLGRKRGPFPLVFGSLWSLEGKLLDDSDSFDTFNIVTADVNGDGVDELILPRANGAIGVYSVEKELFHHSALDAPKGMRFEVKTTHTAKLKGRDVVFFLLALKRKEGHKVHDEALTGVEQAAILRVDQRGISRVPLPKTDGAIEEAHAIGGLNRPGSTDIDEILMMFDTGESNRKTYLSRQRPDGSTIAPPKEVYVPINPSSLSFLFLAETTQAMLADRQDAHLYFIRPDKPANWLADIDLKPLAASPYQIHVLQPIEPGADPKVMVAVENRRDMDFDNAALYAVNSEGQCFRPEPAKDTWQPIGKREPFLRLTSPSPDHRFVGVGAQPGTDTVLAVFSREAKMKELSDEEASKAAEDYLQPQVVEQIRKDELEFTSEKFRLMFEYPFVDEERARRNVTTEITTADEWQHLLPDSYAKAISMMQSDYRFKLGEYLGRPLRDNFSLYPAVYRNIEQYKSWLNGLKLGPETAFEIVRHGQPAAKSSVAGYVPNAISGSFISWPLASHTGTATTSVILPLDTTPSVGLAAQPLAFYLVQFPAMVR